MSKEDFGTAIDQYVAEQMAEQHLPGLSLAVVRDGEVILRRGYGLASLEMNVPVTPETVFQIGSLTKQFTAVAVLMLAERGKIGLDESVSRYVPGLPAAWGGVSVRHLLNHTSGIKSFTGLPDFIDRLAPLPTTREGIVSLIADEPLEFSPGESYAYNNTGYYLLGHVIEQTSGRSYAAFLQERIFNPLAMTDTRVNVVEDIIPNRACGYGWAEDRWCNAPHVSMDWVYSAGALIATAPDLAKWDMALGREDLLPHSAWENAWTPTRLNDGTAAEYGFGWIVSERNGHRSLSHGGGIPGFASFMERFPDDDLSVVVLTNLLPSSTAEIARAVAGHYVPDLRVA